MQLKLSKKKQELATIELSFSMVATDVSCDYETCNCNNCLAM